MLTSESPLIFWALPQVTVENAWAACGKRAVARRATERNGAEAVLNVIGLAIGVRSKQTTEARVRKGNWLRRVFEGVLPCCAHCRRKPFRLPLRRGCLRGLAALQEDIPADARQEDERGGDLAGLGDGGGGDIADLKGVDQGEFDAAAIELKIYK